MPFSDADDPEVNDLTRRVEAATSLDDVITAYTPTSLRPEVWAEVAEVTREVVRRVQPATHPRAHETLRDVGQFLAWCHLQGLEVGIETSFTPDAVEYYIAAGTPHLSAASRATRRAQLRRIGRSAATKAGWTAPAPQIRNQTRLAPYTEAEVARLWEVAAQQRTATLRRRFQVFLALGLGAGMHAREFYTATATDLTHQHGVTMLHVHGTATRDVPVLDDWAPVLWDVATRYPDQPLLGKVLPVTNRSRLWHLMRNIEIPKGVPHPESQRLKTTWIVRLAHHGVLLQEIMVAGGYRTFRTFNHVAAYLPQRPPEVVAHALAGR